MAYLYMGVLPSVQSAITQMMDVPQMSVSSKPITSGYNGNSAPVNIYVNAADFTDPEHVRKMARILGDQIAAEMGGSY